MSDCINYRYSGPAPPQALAVCDHLRISSDVPFLCSEAAMQQIRENIDLIDLTEDTIDVEEQVIEAQLLALKKIPGLGSCIDIELTLVRIGFFFGNHYPPRSGRKGCTPLLRVPYITPPPSPCRLIYRRRQLGPPQPPQSIPRPTPHLHPPIHARGRTIHRRSRSPPRSS